MKHEVLIEETGETYLCDDKETVLIGMCRLGKKGIPVGCRGGGCGVCKVEVTSGEFNSKRMSRDHVSDDDLKNNRVLSCRIQPKSQLSLKVTGKLKKNVCKQTVKQ